MHPHVASGSPQPRLIFWELTTGCNLRCIHCRASATELMSPDDLSYGECCQVIDQLGAFAPFILVLSGGEPLWRSDVFDIAQRARSRGIRVALATNGTLLDEKMAKNVKKAGIERVSISLDGSNRETHDAFRGQDGAFDAAVRGLRCLQAEGVPTQVNTTVTRHNVHQLPDILQLALRLGVDAFHMFLLVPVGCGLTISEDQSIRGEDAEMILNWFYDRSLDSGIELKATCAPHYYRIMRQRRAESRRKGDAVPELPNHGMNAVTRGCLAGQSVCFISHQGEVFPCGYLPVRAGDLRQERFEDIWRNAAIFEDLRHVGHLEGKCGGCEFQRACMGCRARAYGVTGNYWAEEPFCVYEPRRSGAQNANIS